MPKGIKEDLILRKQQYKLTGQGYMATQSTTNPLIQKNKFPLLWVFPLYFIVLLLLFLERIKSKGCIFQSIIIINSKAATFLYLTESKCYAFLDNESLCTSNG